MRRLLIILLIVVAIMAGGYLGVERLNLALRKGGIYPTGMQSRDSGENSDITPLTEGPQPTGPKEETLNITSQRDELLPAVTEKESDINFTKGAGYITLGGLEFYTSLDFGLRESKIKDRPIFLYFRSKYCGWCRKFEAEVLTDERVIESINEDFVPVAIDVYEQGKITSDFKVRGTPTMVFLDTTEEEMKRITGYVNSDTFAQVLDMLGERADKYDGV
ncbi:MAG: thioredoxin family protein [Candidatus Hydrothermarchaeales archaeon]